MLRRCARSCTVMGGASTVSSSRRVRRSARPHLASAHDEVVLFFKVLRHGDPVGADVALAKVVDEIVVLRPVGAAPGPLLVMEELENEEARAKERLKRQGPTGLCAVLLT